MKFERGAQMNEVKLRIISEETTNNFPILERPTREQLKRFCSPSMKIFIETGTYEGTTSVRMTEYGFTFIRSVDIFDLVPDAVKEKIKNLQSSVDIKFEIGESPEKLPVFFKEIREKFGEKNREIVFWLDAHASGPIKGGKYGGSPILHELKEIAKDDVKTHTIFIDDRRLFESAEWSFVKEKDCIDLLKKINPNYKIFYIDGYEKNDVIVATVYDNN